MFSILLLFCSIFVLVSTINGNLTFEELELQLIQVVARHGLRAPEFPYPTSQYNESYWPYGWGQLTQLGMEQQYGLGKALRRRYNTFVSSAFLAKEVYATSSDYDRTILSAQIAFAGFYENRPNDFGEYVPVRPIPKATDKMIQPNIPCPRRKKIYDEYLAGPEVQKYYKDNTELYSDLRQQMGYSENVTSEVYNSIGSLSIERLHNLSIPIWASAILDSEEKMNTIAKGFSFLTGTNELKRFGGGPILKNILSNMENKLKGSENRRLFYYSGHDILLANILNTMGAFKLHWPTFSAALLFELYLKKSTNEHIVQIKYKNSTSSEELVAIEVSGCPDPCTLEKFKEALFQFLPEDLDKECQLNANSSTLVSTLDAWLIGGIVTLTILLLAVIVFMINKFGKKAYIIST